MQRSGREDAVSSTAEPRPNPHPGADPRDQARLARPRDWERLQSMMDMDEFGHLHIFWAGVRTNGRCTRRELEETTSEDPWLPARQGEAITAVSEARGSIGPLPGRGCSLLRGARAASGCEWPRNIEEFWACPGRRGEWERGAAPGNRA